MLERDISPTISDPPLPLFETTNHESDEYPEDTRLDAHTLFMQDISKFPVLTAVQEKLLFTRFKASVSMEELKEDPEFHSTINPINKEKFDHLISVSPNIRDMIRNSNLRLVVFWARRYKQHDLLEAIQEGSFGLSRAVDLFEPERDLKFSTYASNWIKQKIMRSYDESALIRLPVHMGTHIRAVRRDLSTFVSENGREPTREESIVTLEKRGISRKTAILVLDTLEKNTSSIASLDKPLSKASSLTLKDVINIQAPTDDRVELREMNMKLGLALESLDEKERAILSLRFGLIDDSPKTLESIGKRYGLTRERIRQIERVALSKLRGSALLKDFSPRGDGEVVVYEASEKKEKSDRRPRGIIDLQLLAERIPQNVLDELDLTPKERIILDYVAQGISTEEIMRRTGFKKQSIYKYRVRIRNKFNEAGFSSPPKTKDNLIKYKIKSVPRGQKSA